MNNFKLSRMYDDLPSHNVFYFSLSIFLFGFLQSDVLVMAFYDSTHFSFSNIYNEDVSQSHCNSSDPRDLKKVRISGKFEHTDPSLTFLIEAYASRPIQKGFMAFRDFILLLRNDTSHNKNDYNNPKCLEAEYYRDGVCKPCDPLCKTCIGPSTSECFECVDGAFFDGLECIMCHESCKNCFGPSENECSSCFNDYYMFEGSSCVSTCQSPLVFSIIGSKKYCSFPCLPDEFLYSNGECRASCDFKYNAIMGNNKKFCSYYCPIDGQYYVPSSTVGGTCSSDCPSGYYKDTITRYCIPCQDNLCLESAEKVHFERMLAIKSITFLL